MQTREGEEARKMEKMDRTVGERRQWPLRLVPMNTHSLHRCRLRRTRRQSPPTCHLPFPPPKIRPRRYLQPWRAPQTAMFATSTPSCESSAGHRTGASSLGPSRIARIHLLRRNGSSEDHAATR
jgi:hypothetical protein